jgi:hypothetical protein
MTIRFKGGKIPKEFLHYNPHSPLNQPGGVRLNPYLKNLQTNQKFDFRLTKTFAQPDMTAYSQGNVGNNK